MNCRNNLNIKHYTTVRSEWPRKYCTSYIQTKYRILYLKKNLKSFTTMLKGSKGSVTLLLVDRSAECFRAKEWEPKNRCIHIFFFLNQAEVTSFPGSLSFAFPMTREAQEREPRNKVVSQPVFLGQLFWKSSAITQWMFWLVIELTPFTCTICSIPQQCLQSNYFFLISATQR